MPDPKGQSKTRELVQNYSECTTGQYLDVRVTPVFFTGDGMWSTWSEWVYTSLVDDENSFIYTNLTIAMCKKTIKSRQRQCSGAKSLESGVSGCNGEVELSVNPGRGG